MDALVLGGDALTLWLDQVEGVAGAGVGAQEYVGTEDHRWRVAAMSGLQGSVWSGTRSRRR